MGVFTLAAEIEEDGVASRLFELLWKKDLLNGASIALRIPDTVIYRFNYPSCWFFTSVDGTIKRKSKAKVNREHIAEEFLKRPSPSGIVAYFVSTVPESEAGGAEDDDAPANTRTTLEYFSPEGLHDFLTNRHDRPRDGILQRFIEPGGGHNNMVRALWSPKVCVLERRINRLRVADTRYDMYERAVTFEGPDFHSEVSPVRTSALVSKVHEIADAIVRHVGVVTKERTNISRLALNFKTDDRDRFWLLFVSSVRLRDGFSRSFSSPAKAAFTRPLEVDTTFQVPEHVQLNCPLLRARPSSFQKARKCTTCQELVEADRLFNASYKLILEYEQQHEGAAEPDCVPRTLQLLHPRLTLQEYEGLRHDIAFQHKTTQVCETCYLQFSTPQLGRHCRPSDAPHAKGIGVEHGYPSDIVSVVEQSQQLVGTQQLDPERLRLQRCKTLVSIAQQQAEEEEYQEELLRQEREERRKARAKSCPKLLSCVSLGQRGPVVPLHAPKSVPLYQPKPPQGAAPPWNLRPDRQLDCTLLPQPRKPASVPPLKGDPYLRDLQDFAAQCRDRASEVLGPRAYTKAAAGWGLARSVPGRPRAEAAPVPEQLRAVEESAREDDEGGRGAEAEVPEEDVPECDDEECVFEDSVGSEPIMAQLWEKWPPSCGFGVGSTTPTTRPPSQGDTNTLSGPSSCTGSRPSSRPSSRSTASGRSKPFALRRLRAERPSSSPLVRSDGTACLQRSSSSPHLDADAEGADLSRPPSALRQHRQAAPASLRGRPPPLAPLACGG